MYQLVQLHGNLPVVEKHPVSVKQAQVRNQSEGVGHGHDTVLDLDPIPCNSRRVIFGRLTPQGLSGTGGFFVANCQHSRTEMYETALVCRTRLPQYGRPCIDDPSRGYRRAIAQFRFDDGYSLKSLDMHNCDKWLLCCHLSMLSGFANIQRVKALMTR